MRFVDLCCGIGGFRLGLEALGHECVASCELDRHARDAYAANFGCVEFEDVMALRASALPAHEIVCCGFPCRTFSRAGRCQCDLTLITHVLTAVCNRARFVVLENTSTFPTVGGGRAHRAVRALLHEQGFASVHEDVYSVADVTGLPQPRKRWVCVAERPAADDAEAPAALALALVAPFVPRPLAPLPAARRLVLKDVLRSPAEWAPRPTAELAPPPSRTFRPRRPTYRICWVGSRSPTHKQNTRVCHRLGLGYTLTAKGRVYVHEPKRRNGRVVDRILTAKEMILYMGFPPSFRLPNRSRLVATKLLGRAVPPALIERVVGAFAALGPATAHA